jgi:hypothetical protein
LPPIKEKCSLLNERNRIEVHGKPDNGHAGIPYLVKNLECNRQLYDASH